MVGGKVGGPLNIVPLLLKHFTPNFLFLGPLTQNEIHPEHQKYCRQDQDGDSVKSWPVFLLFK